MSIRMGIAVAGGLFVAGGLVGAANAEMLAPAPKAKSISVRGCATKGIPDFCTVIKGPKGAVYNVSGANPPVPVGKLVRLMGTDTGAPSPCNGSTVTGIKWTELKGKCPK